MATGIFSRSEAKKRHYYKNKKQGVCQNCSEKVVEGKTRCKKHLDYQKAWRYSQIHGSGK